MAGYVSGPTLKCLNDRCQSTNLRLVTEKLDTYDQVYVASVECLDCHCSMLDSRRGKQKRPYDQNGLIAGREEEFRLRAEEPSGASAPGTTAKTATG